MWRNKPTDHASRTEQRRQPSHKHTHTRARTRKTPDTLVKSVCETVGSRLSYSLSLPSQKAVRRPRRHGAREDDTGFAFHTFDHKKDLLVLAGRSPDLINVITSNNIKRWAPPLMTGKIFGRAACQRSILSMNHDTFRDSAVGIIMTSDYQLQGNDVIITTKRMTTNFVVCCQRMKYSNCQKCFVFQQVKK